MLEKVKRLVKNPKLVSRLLNRLYHTRFGYRDFNIEGINIFDEDWDNLIILDACRFELFRERVEVDKFGKFESRISRGANTYDFVRGNFFDRDLSDTVYLTSNAHIFWMEDELDVGCNIYDKKLFDKGENDDKVGATLPETVRNQTLKLKSDYEKKRLVIHFVQPHYPFLDESKRFPLHEGNFWDKVFRGEIEGSFDEFWDAYAETFDKAWEEVEKLIEQLDGKTVVTSDHGNVFGERVSPIPMKEWGHPQGIYDEKLVKVPWLVIEGDERREIVKGEPEESEDYDEEEIKSQLADLGYGE